MTSTSILQAAYPHSLESLVDDPRFDNPPWTASPASDCITRRSS